MELNCSKAINQLQIIKDSNERLAQSIGEFFKLTESEGASVKIKISQLQAIYTSRKEIRLLIEELEEEAYKFRVKAKNILMVNGEVQETKVEINFDRLLAEAKKFYQDYVIAIPEDFEERAREIWTRNYEEIRKEVERYGYDHILIIPDELPPMRDLWEKMARGYWQSPSCYSSSDVDNLNFAGNCGAKIRKFRLVLVHQANAQNIGDHMLLKEIEGKNLQDVTPLSSWDFNAKVRSQRQHILPLEIELKDVILGDGKKPKDKKIFAEGLSLDEYLIWQRQYFEATGKHLDEYSQTRLTSTIVDKGSGWDKTIIRAAYSIPEHDRPYLYLMFDPPYEVSSTGWKIPGGYRPSKSFR